MPELKRIRVYYEGDDDRVVLEGLQRMRLLPESCEIARRDKQHPGKDGLVREVAPFVRPVNGVGGNAMVLVDLDDLSVDTLIDWFRRQIADHIKGTIPPMTLEEKRAEKARATRFSIVAEGRSGRLVLVPVGVPEDEGLRTAYGIDKFAIDDHILRLVSEQAVYEALSELEAVSYTLAMRKLTEVADLLRKNTIAIRQTKRILHILRAVAAVRPSSAVFVERLMKKAGEKLDTSQLRAIFDPLVSDLEAAAELLTD